MSGSRSILVARNNTFVAESDLEAATRAIDLCFEKELSSLQNALSDDEEAGRIQVALLTDCRDSLLSHVERVVEPVSDEAFYQFINDGDTKDSLKSLLKRQDLCKLGPVHEDHLGDFDVEELVDQQASQRARDLRKSARDEVQHLRDLRIAVIDRATSLAKRQVDVLTKHQQNIIPQSAKHSNNIQLQEVSNEADAKLSGIRDHVNLVCASLQQGRESNITCSVSSLDETVSNVRNALEIPPNTSKTSRAILERNVDDTGNGSVKHINMPDRFIKFLGQ